MLTKWFNCVFNFLIFILPIIGVMAQDLTLKQCHEMGVANSPLMSNADHIQSIYELERLNQWNNHFPTMVLNGTASFQSDIFELPFSPPGVEVPEIPKDQYRLNLSISQKIYDGGLIKNQQAESEVQRDLNQAQLEVSLYKTREMITSAFFGILLLQENDQVLNAVRQELQNQLKRSEVSFENGLILKGEVNTLKIEILKNTQLLRNLAIHRIAFYRVLSDLMGVEIDSSRKLVNPDFDLNATTISRPELMVFDRRSDQLQIKQSYLDVSRRPRVSGFATVGYGQPNQFNFFETDFSDYYIVGLQMEWKVWDWGFARRSKEKLGISQMMLENEKQNFVKSVDQQAVQKRAEIEQMTSMIETDIELLALQNEITEQDKQQFELGTKSAIDYVSTLSNQTQTELQLSRHQTELAKAKVEFLHLIGNKP